MSAILQGLPTFTGAALLLKLAGSGQIVGQTRRSCDLRRHDVDPLRVDVALARPKFPGFVKNSYEALFFDASLSFSEKVLRWRTQPTTSLQLLTNVVMLSLLAVAVMCVG